MHTYPTILYVPANNERALAKLSSLNVGGVILDCEDAVSFKDKQLARDAVLNLLKDKSQNLANLTVRVNDINSPLGLEDLKTFSKTGVQNILFPKIQTPDDISKIRHILEHFEYAPTNLWLMMETPRAINACAQIAKQSPHTCFPMTTWIFGTNDLAKDIQLANPSLASYDQIASQLIIAAKSAHITIYDGVTNTFKETNAVLEDAQRAFQLGFNGKTLIHPSQIEPVEQAFTLKPEMRTYFKELINTFEEALSSGKSVAILNGQMIEELHFLQAKEALKLSQVNR